MTDFSKPGVVLLTIRISDVIGGPSEKITLSMPSDLISKIDKFVADSPYHQSRSAFLADAALKLNLDQSEDFDYKDVKIPGPRLTTEF